MRKSFKKYILVLVVIFMFVNMFGGLVYSASPVKGFQVTGSALYDANGNQFIIRGVNHAHTWYKDQLNTVIPTLAKAGCNAVRIVLSDGGQWTEDSVSSVTNIISLCEQNKIVAVLEVHDATGKDEQAPLLAAANYFAKIKDALIGKEDRVIINIANEWTGTWDSSSWAEGYKKAIPIIRNAGLTHTIMVDAGGWGQYGQCVKDYGKDVFNSDTLKNTIFSIHMYGTAGKDASTIKGNIDGVINQGLALCIGEFGWKHSDGDVDEATIMSYCKEKNVGWMAWSWKGNGGGVEYLDLSNDWTGTSLSAWGDTIINGTNGLKETSKICSVFGSSNNTTGMRDITAFQLVNEMSVGWNLGNTFDAPTETKWGNPVTTKAMIYKINQQGFNTLRLPVTWDTHLGAAPNYTIDPAWIKRVEEVANYALDNNMYVILNLHHEDTWIMPTYANQTKISDKLTKVWTQIANHFKNYGDHLIFETMNEPRLTGSTEEWTGGTSEGRDVVNKLNVVAVSTIRATGGNNEKRFIMAPTYAASTVSAAVNDYKLPNNDSRVIVSLHMYSPYFFAMDADGTSSWGSDNDKSSLKAEFDAINTRFIKNGMAVVIGEFGTIHKNNESSRVAHAEYYVKTAKAIGITCCWWDNGYFKAGEANSYEIFNRSGLTWQVQSIADALVKGAGSTPIKVILGDVNKDTQVTIIDAMLLKKYILKKVTENDLDMTAADYNKDSNVNSIDYLLLKQALMQVK